MSKREQLDQLYKELEKNLSELPLGSSGEPTVPGDGNPEAELMFIGEAPGYNESVERKPFVGRSGQLFIQTLAEVGFARSTVFISNVVKVRPPDNRDPTPAEIAAYKPYLDKEIEIIQPKLIVTLGRFSMGKFLPTVKVSQVHGRLHKVVWKNKHLFVLPMYHPAAALRATQLKNAFVADFEKIPKILEWMKTKGEQLATEQQELTNFESSIKASLL